MYTYKKNVWRSPYYCQKQVWLYFFKCEVSYLAAPNAVAKAWYDEEDEVEDMMREQKWVDPNDTPCHSCTLSTLGSTKSTEGSLNHLNKAASLYFYSFFALIECFCNVKVS